MHSLILAGRVKRPIDAKYTYSQTARTKVFDPMTFAEMRLVSRMLNFDDWVDENIPEELESVDRNAFACLAWSEEASAWKIRQIIITDHSSEALLMVQGESAMLNQKREHKLYKTHNAVENDLLRLLQPETGEPVVCNVGIRTTNRMPAKDAE